MADAHVTYAKPTEDGYKPLILVVRSTHLERVKNEQIRDYILEQRFEAMYVRSRFMGSMALLYSPVNIHLDSVTPGTVSDYNDFLSHSTQKLKEFFIRTSPEIPPAWFIKDQILMHNPNQRVLTQENAATESMFRRLV